MNRYLSLLLTIVLLAGSLSLCGCSKARRVRDRIKDDLRTILHKMQRDAERIDRKINDKFK